MNRFGLTQAQAAERLEQPRATVANILRLLELSDSVQKMVASSCVSFGHAKVLAGLIGQPEFQEKLARQIVAEGLSVRQLEQLVQRAKDVSPDQPGQIDTKKTPTKPALIRDLEDQLTQAVGTRVQVNPSRKKNTGRITIEYYSLDDFDRITRCLGAKLEG